MQNCKLRYTSSEMDLNKTEFKAQSIVTDKLSREIIGSPICYEYIPIYLSLSPTWQDLTQGQKPEGRLKWG